MSTALYCYAPNLGQLGTRIDPDKLDPALNAGLLFYRFCGAPPRRSRGLSSEEARNQVNTGNVAATFADVYARAGVAGGAEVARLQAAMDAAGGFPFPAKEPVSAPEGWTHWYLDANLATRMAIGLGNDHPFENGLTLHHTSGAAFIPGTALKGVLRSWLELVDGDGEGAAALTDDHRAWLGAGGDKDATIGRLVLYDALPVKWPKLEVDIINCHLPGYYRGTHNPGAVGKEDPVPATMLVIAAGTTFRLRVGARARGAGSDVLADARVAYEAIKELREALQTTGAGAKTASGYGYFL